MKSPSWEIEVINKELVGQRRLLDQGLTSMNRVNNLDRDATKVEGERGQLIASMAAAKGRIAEIELQLLQVDQTMRAEVATELRDVGNQQAELVEQEVTALDQLKHIEIKASIAGAGTSGDINDYDPIGKLGALAAGCRGIEALWAGLLII
jgi:HlyD family secretion protein